jgi:hypothetical protein
VLLAVLMPEVHSAAATALFAEASVPLAISSWSQAQAEAVLQGFERSLAPGLLMLELEPQDFRNANACQRGGYLQAEVRPSESSGTSRAQCLPTLATRIVSPALRGWFCLRELPRRISGG